MTTFPKQIVRCTIEYLDDYYHVWQPLDTIEDAKLGSPVKYLVKMIHPVTRKEQWAGILEYLIQENIIVPVPFGECFAIKPKKYEVTICHSKFIVWQTKKYVSPIIGSSDYNVQIKDPSNVLVPKPGRKIHTENTLISSHRLGICTSF